MYNKKELDQKLLEACTADQINLTEIEQLLKDGANPRGCVEDYDGDNNLYDVVLYHFLLVFSAWIIDLDSLAEYVRINLPWIK